MPFVLTINSMGTGKYNVTDIPCSTINEFWSQVDSIADLDGQYFMIDCVVDGLVTLGLDRDGFYYELSFITNDCIASGFTIIELMELIVGYASFRVYNTIGEEAEGVLIASCSYKTH